MKPLFCLLAGLVLLTTSAAAQQVRVVKLPALQQLLTRPSDTTYIINFWATWCKPCIEELPNFEQVRARHAREKVKVVLVSMDFPSKLDSKVKPFVKQQKLASAVWLLNESDPNVFIDKIEPSWSGALPFTLLVNTRRKQRKAIERPLTRAELETELKAFLP
jgi:thiol-disulfide isomerase/thioredoxin